MKLKLISAETVVFEGEVSQVTLPGIMGEFQVLKNHASLISTLSAGRVKYVTTEGTEGETTIPGGLADIDRNVISVCIY